MTDRCIKISAVCDGKPDCPNGADEGPGCDLNECGQKNSQCTYKCIESPNVSSCLVAVNIVVAPYNSTTNDKINDS